MSRSVTGLPGLDASARLDSCVYAVVAVWLRTARECVICAPSSFVCTDGFTLSCGLNGTQPAQPAGASNASAVRLLHRGEGGTDARLLT